MAADELREQNVPKAGRDRGGFLAGLRNFAIFLIALVGSCMLIAALLPFPNLGNLWRKYHHVRDHGEDYSVIYLGSSRVFHEFMPQQFDEELAAKGHPVRSFNFGQDGMWPPESLYMVRQLLKIKPPKLKYLIIDLMAVRAEIDGNAATKRAVYWHDFRHTLLACRQIFEVDMTGQRTFAEKAALAWRHIELFAQQSTSLGRFQDWFEVRLKLVDKRRPTKVPLEGFEAGGVGPLKGKQLEDFNRAIVRLKSPKLKPKVMPAVMRDAYDDLIEEVRAAGVEPIFVVASSIYGAERFRDWPPERVTVVRFDDPVAFPELYDPGYRYDPHHLDARGAKLFTHRLAEQFADVLERAK